MKISVTITPNSRKEEVVQISEREFRVKVGAPAKEGKANERLYGLLAEYFHVPKSTVFIVSGHTSRQKVVEIFGK
jgi:uncharacterized protein